MTSYTPQIWTQCHIYITITKYEVNFAIIMQNHFLFFVLSCKKLHNMNKIEVTISHMSKTTTKWKRVIYYKIMKKNHQIRSLYERNTDFKF